MFERVTPYYYSGEGEVLLSKRLSNGQPEGFLPLGKLSKVVMNIKESFKIHRDSRSSGHIDKARSTGIQVDIILNVEQADSVTLAKLLKGKSQVIPADNRTEYHEVCPGFRYAVERIGLAELTIKDQGGVIPYVEGENYEESLDVGGFYILEDQSGAAHAINCNEIVEVSFSHTEQKETNEINAVKDEYWMRVEGLNTAQDDTPVTLDFYRVMPQLVTDFSILAEKRESSNLTSTLLCDSLRVEEDQLFKIRTIN